MVYKLVVLTISSLLIGHLMFLTSISCVLDGREVSLVVGLVVRQWTFGLCIISLKVLLDVRYGPTVLRPSVHSFILFVLDIILLTVVSLVDCCSFVGCGQQCL